MRVEKRTILLIIIIILKFSWRRPPDPLLHKWLKFFPHTTPSPRNFWVLKVPNNDNINIPPPPFFWSVFFLLSLWNFEKRYFHFEIKKIGPLTFDLLPTGLKCQLFLVLKNLLRCHWKSFDCVTFRIPKDLLSTFPLYIPHCHMILSKQKCCFLLSGVSTESQKRDSL